MKLFEMSAREHIALAVLPAFAGRTNHVSDTAGAFLAADEFMKQCAGYRDEIRDALLKAEKAVMQYQMLLNIGNDVPARIALTEIWEELGADNQTTAMGEIRDLKVRLRVAEELSHD